MHCIIEYWLARKRTDAALVTDKSSVVSIELYIYIWVGGLWLWMRVRGPAACVCICKVFWPFFFVTDERVHTSSFMCMHDVFMHMCGGAGVRLWIKIKGRYFYCMDVIRGTGFYLLRYSCQSHRKVAFMGIKWSCALMINCLKGKVAAIIMVVIRMFYIRYGRAMALLFSKRLTAKRLI